MQDTMQLLGNGNHFYLSILAMARANLGISSQKRNLLTLQHLPI